MSGFDEPAGETTLPVVLTIGTTTIEVGTVTAARDTWPGRLAALLHEVADHIENTRT